MSLAALIDRAQRQREQYLLDRGVTAAELHSASPDTRDALGRIRGFANELRVLRALQAAALPNWIISYRRGRRLEDKRGGDLVLLCQDGRRYRIEIKSSNTGAERFDAECRRRGMAQRVGILVVGDDMTDERIAERVVGILELLRAYASVEDGR